MAAAPKQEKDSDSGLESTASQSSLNEEVEIQKNQRKNKVFYELFADGTFKFSDGETLKVNMALLIIESSVFQQLFNASSPGYVVNIEDFDLATFKLYLDCLLEFQEFSAEEALLIFPVTWKYETEQLTNKCLEILKPSALNENVCLSLNIGLFYKCKKLIKSVLDFLVDKNRIYQLLDEESYRDHLEPESLLKLLKRINVLDSCVLTNIIAWGRRYLEKRNKNSTLKEFFIEKNINHYFDLVCFKTAGSFLQFSKSEIGKEFFNESDFLIYVQRFGYDARPINWVKVKKGENFVEKFIIKKVFFMRGYVAELKLKRHPVIFFDTPDEEEEILAIYNVVGKLLDSGEENKVGFRMRTAERRYTALRVNAQCVCHSLPMQDIMSDVEVEIKISFKYDCKIFKSLPNESIYVDANREKDWFFFHSAEIIYEKNK